MSFKLTLKNETHLVRNRPSSFKELEAVARESYKLSSVSLSFYYIDEDGDRITISGDADLQTVYESYKEKSPKICVDIDEIEETQVQ